MESSRKSQRIEQTRPFREAVLIFLWQFAPWGAAIIVLLLGIVICFSAAGDRKQELDTARQEAAKARVEERVPVLVAAVTPVEFRDSITLPGEIRAWEAVEIYPEVTGKIVAVAEGKPYAIEGDWVTKGQVLARIDDRDYTAALADAQARLKLAELTWKRTKQLAKEGAQTVATLDQDTASYDQARAAAETARLNLARCTIVAPFDGVINARSFSIGTLAGPATKLFDMLDIHKVKVRVAIPQADVELVQHVRGAEVHVDGFEKPFHALNHFLSYNTSAQAKVYELQLELDNADRQLRPGMMVEADIVRETKEGAIAVPLYAILTNGTDQFCYIAEGDKAAKRPVRVGRINGTEAEILSGLAFNDRLIVKGQRQCIDGTLLSVLEHDVGTTASTTSGTVPAPASAPKAPATKAGAPQS